MACDSVATVTFESGSKISGIKDSAF
jgi:hypothetical protein